MVIDFHPAASDEAEAANDWYAARSTIAAARFREELDAAVEYIQTNPDHGGPYLHGTRCYLMRRFPYLVVFHRPSVEVIEVVAVAHARRRPGYWKSRIS